MRIALCLEYPIALRGGVSVLVETLAEEFIDRGHEVVVVSSDTPESFKNSILGARTTLHIPWTNSRPAVSESRWLAEELDAARVDVAHFHLGGSYGFANRLPFRSPIYFSARRGIKCFSTVHLVVDLLESYCGPDKPSWFKLAMLPVAWFGKCQQLRSVSSEIAVSIHDATKLRKRYFPCRDRIIQLYHSRLKTGGELPSASVRTPVILYVGHFAWRKGQAVLVEAFCRIAREFPEWQLHLVGGDDTGEVTTRIQALVSEHKLEGRVVLLGERSDALKLMQSAAIYVQPSFWEALGLALQEAMACGAACVGTRVGGIPELIRDGETGLLVDAGDGHGLAQALSRLMGDEGLRARFGSAAARSIQERGMNAGTMAERHLKLYEAAIAS